MVQAESNSTGHRLVGAKAQYVQKIPGDNSGYYDDEEYLTNRVLGAAVIGILVAIFACACGICFCFAQVCAKCCDFCKKCCVCCGADDPPPEGYTQNQRLCLVGILFFGWVMIVAGSALGYSGNAQVSEKLIDFSDVTSLIANDIYDQVKMGFDAAELVGTAPDPAMVTTAADLKKTVEDAGKTLKENQDMNVLVVYIFYGIMMVVPVLGFISWMCGIACPSYVMTQISFCMLFVAWLFFGITFALGVILDDTCDNAGKHVYGEPNALSDLLKCGEAPSSQETYFDVWKKLDEIQLTYTEQGYNVYPDAYPTEMSVGFTTNNASAPGAVAANSARYARNRLLLISEYRKFGIHRDDCASLGSTAGKNSSSTVLCFVPGITKERYQTVCMDGQEEALDRDCLQQGMVLSTAGMTGTSYLSSCEHLNTLALALNNEICNDMVDGLINVCVGQAFIGFFYFFVVAVGCMGMNRFNSDNYSDHPARVHPEQQPDIESQQQQAYAMPKQDVTPDGQYSAEQAMAATRIQSAQRQKTARSRVNNKRQTQKGAVQYQ